MALLDFIFEVPHLSSFLRNHRCFVSHYEIGDCAPMEAIDFDHYPLDLKYENHSQLLAFETELLILPEDADEKGEFQAEPGH
jgi:hypothetical protein